MNLIKQILNTIKSYFKRLAELQNEVIEFQKEYENQMWRDRK